MSLLVDNRGLLDRFRAGDPAAMTEVFRHYTPGIAALLRRGFGFQHGAQRVRFAGYDELFDVEDALQEIFRRAFSDNARMAYDGLRPYRSYLGAIARNTVISAFVARKRLLQRFEIAEREAQDTRTWSAAHDPLEFHGEAEPTGRPEYDLENTELRRLIAEFRRGLSQREQQIFHLRFERCLSHREIQSETRVSASKIKTSEARIRKALLRFMRQHGYLRRTGRRAARGAKTRRATQGEGR